MATKRTSPDAGGVRARKYDHVGALIVFEKTKSAPENQEKSLPPKATLTRRWPEFEPAHLRRVAQRIHACGPRAAFEFVADLARGRDFVETLADFGRLDPALYTAVMARVCDGGHA